MTTRRHRAVLAPLCLVLATSITARAAEHHHGAPLYEKGDRVRDDVEFVGVFPGMDLPAAPRGEAYLRTDEHVYRVNRRTLVVIEVIRIGAVILH